MKVLVLVFLPNLSKSVHRVREFRRCKEQGNQLIYLGRPITPAEFNAVEERVMDSRGLPYGIQPRIKLIEVIESVESVEVLPIVAPVLVESPVIVPKLVDASPLPEGVEFESVEGGFILCDMRGEGISFLGSADKTPQIDISLVLPFASKQEALEFFHHSPSPSPVEPSDVKAPTAPVVEVPKKSHHKKK